MAGKIWAQSNINLSGGSSIIARSNFPGGTIDPFTSNVAVGASITVIDNTTGSGLSKVVKIRYLGNNGSGGAIDVDRRIGYGIGESPPITPPAVLTYGKDYTVEWGLYFPSDIVDFAVSGIQRKIAYFRTEPGAGGPGSAFDVHLIWTLNNGGNRLALDYTENNVTSGSLTTDFPDPITVGVWHRMKIRIRHESAPGVTDGILQFFVDGTKVWEKLNRSFTAAGQSSSFGWDSFWIGEQRERNRDDLSLVFDEYRLIDDLVITALN